MKEENKGFSFNYDEGKTEEQYLSDLSNLYKAFERTYQEWTPSRNEMELEYQIEKNETALMELYGCKDHNEIKEKVSHFRKLEKCSEEKVDLFQDSLEKDISEYEGPDIADDYDDFERV